MASDALSIRQGDTSAVLEDLTRDSFRLLLPVTAAVTWAWAVAVLYGMERHAPHAYGVMALMAVVVWLGYRLHRRWLRLAIAIYLVGAVAATTTIALSFRGVGALYLYVVILPVAATLVSPDAVWGLASVAGALVVAIGRAAYGLPLVQMALPVTTIFLAALALWLSSRRLLTALAWALNMTREAQKSAALAREHRAEVRRVLKSLDEAYVRLERANEALIYAREAAERAYQFKAEFVANVSHELRTPLNLIVGFSELIATAPESYGGAILPNPYRGDVMAIYRSARHLTDLINDVLDLSRLEAGAMPLLKEEADIGEVAKEAAEMVRGLAEARGLQLELSIPEGLPPVRLDRTRIRQVLLNLLTNATRFTERGWIALRIRTEHREVLVSVEDSGQGIPPDRLARAFEAFSQLDDDHVRQGSGLGLAVSKRFVELHGGRMWIDSKPGRGTTVGFSLPLAEGVADGASRRSRNALPHWRSDLPTVLVLHDDARTLSLLRRYVDGCEFVVATTPDEARHKVGEVFPVAVVVDSGWPGGVPA
ncbi:MAG: HAMP domain-containing histidine kinase, partial [Anaerolineae bacterium]|nr:HAMP domain-containing histidine kinase [Anaerolineae bacterium]